LSSLLPFPTRRSSDLFGPTCEFAAGAVSPGVLVTVSDRNSKILAHAQIAGAGQTIQLDDAVHRRPNVGVGSHPMGDVPQRLPRIDRKSTRLDSSHVKI